jgi:hypothetical protein
MEISGNYARRIKSWVETQIAAITLRLLPDVDDSGIGNDKFLQYKAASGKHEYVAGAGVTDHGALNGLADDDHPQYTTDAEVDAIVLTHKNIAAAHHSKYTDAEVDAIVATHTAIAAAHHSKYTDVEAVTAMGAKGDANPLHHDRVVKYTDANAVSALHTMRHIVRVRRTTNQDIADSTITTVLFNQEDEDADNLYNPATGKITIPENGIYFFTATVLFSSGFVDQKTQWVGINVYRDPTETEIAHSEGQSSGTSYESRVVAVVFSAQTGDLMYVRAYHNKGSAHQIRGVADARTVFQMVQISKG